jgi:hypothetical protein
LKYGTYAPLWKGVLWKYSETPLTSPPHYNHCENYFGEMKQRLDKLEDDTGPGPMKTSKFVSSNLQLIDSKLDFNLNKVAKRHVSRLAPYQKRIFKSLDKEILRVNQENTQSKRKRKKIIPGVHETPFEVEEPWIKKLKRTPQSHFK